MAKKKVRKKEEKDCEIFEIEKGGKKVEKTACGVVPGKKIGKKERENQNNILIGFFIVVGAIVVLMGVWFLISYSVRYFDYEGVKFEIVNEEDLIFYKTSVPVNYQGGVADYNFYLRNDPRELGERVPLEGEVSYHKNMVFNLTTENLFCEGDWSLALGNLATLYQIMSINISVEKVGAKYEPVGDYMFIKINEANKTEIVKTAVQEYEINVADCEVLPAFERLMLDTFVRFEEVNKK